MPPLRSESLPPADALIRLSGLHGHASGVAEGEVIRCVRRLSAGAVVVYRAGDLWTSIRRQDIERAVWELVEG